MNPNVTKAFRIASLAFNAGYATRVKNGRLQFVVISYDAAGNSDIRPVTDWLTPKEAAEIING